MLCNGTTPCISQERDILYVHSLDLRLTGYNKHIQALIFIRGVFYTQLTRIMHALPVCLVLPAVCGYLFYW